MELVQSKVEFDELNHTYKLGDKKLSGITGILSKYVFPDKYKDVPDFVLQKAKDKGSLIHNEIHMALLGFKPSEPTNEYLSFKGLNINWLASEYLVSDNENFASSIDLIDNDLNLYDIKTSYKLDKEYVSWQLSIYAYLFELQNPGLKIKNLAGIHLRGDVCKLVPVERKSTEQVKELFDVALGKKEALAVNEEDSRLTRLAQIEMFIVEQKNALDTLEKQRDEMKNILLNEMNKRNISKFESDLLTITKKEAYERKSIDSKQLQEEEPEIYKKYLKVTQVKESIVIKLK